MYAAAVPLDELGDDVEISEYRPVLDEYRKECNKLDADDALLADFRRFCPLLADLQKQLTVAGECEDQAQLQQCLDGVSGFRVVVRKFLREGERLDGVIERTDLDAACKKALVTPEAAYEVTRGYGRAFAYLERAIRTSSAADLEMAEALMKRAEAKSAEVPKAKEALADFRAGCD